MKILLFLALLLEFSFATVIHVSQDYSLLEKSSIYIGSKNISKSELQEKLKTYNKKYINLGVTHNTIWIKLDFKNLNSKTITKVLVLSSPLLEDISLFSSTLKPIEENGMLYQQKTHQTIPYLFQLTFQPKQKVTYYLRVSSKNTPISFSILLEEKDKFFTEDRRKQFINTLLIGAILSMMLYSLVISLYQRDKSYFFYSLYLFALLYQQVTYLGITQIYAPYDFIALEATLTIEKILFLILTSALFAMHFLQTDRLIKVNIFYKLIILVIILEFFLLDTDNKFSLNMVIITGAVFIVGNLISGIYAYIQGIKEARLFILGFGVVFFSYMMMIIDALGWAPVMIYFPNLLIGSTPIEALILLLAFSDRYLILQKEKESAEQKVLKELKNRKELITKEVVKKTKALNKALEEKELLLQEVHHRVKNNLQIILSLIRLQTDSVTSNSLKEKLNIVENRINAIAKTYSMLLSKDNFKTIDMEKYIDELINDLVFVMDKNDIIIQKEIHLQLPIKEAIYIGLIINELITNAFKYAFEQNRGIINIKLYSKDKKRFLIISDNGKGYKMDKNNSSLGLKLVKTIVNNQLKGEISIDSSPHTVSMIKF